MVNELPLSWERVSLNNAADFFVARTLHNESGIPSVLLSGHIDTVFPPSLGQYDASVENEIIKGPGSQDMLGGVMVMIETMRRLNNEGKLKNLVIALSPEEEIVTPNHRPTIEKLSNEVTYVMVFEPESIDSSDYTPYVKSLTRSRRGGGKYSISFTGPGGHSGELSQKQDRNSCNIAAAKMVVGIEEKISDYAQGTTLNIGLMNGGEQFNVISPSASLVGEFRCKSQQEYSRVIQKLTQMTSDVSGHNIRGSFNLDAGAPPLVHTKKSAEFMNLIHKVAQRLGVTIVEQDKTGVSEANLYMAANPDLSVIDGFGVVGGGEHTQDSEYAYIRSITDSTILATEIIKELQGI